MMKNFLRTAAMIFMAAFCFFMIGGLPPDVVIADSVNQFSNQQGQNGWSYGYWDRHTDTPYDPAIHFQLLKHYGVDPINRLSGHAEFTTGPLWNLQDGHYYTSLWAEGGHANSAMKLGNYAAAEQWAVRRWVSTMNGRVRIHGRVGKVMPWGKNWGGGCQAMIVVDGKTELATVMDNSGSDYSIDVTIHKGSTVDFLIGPGPSIGVVTFTATIRTAPEKK